MRGQSCRIGLMLAREKQQEVVEEGKQCKETSNAREIGEKTSTREEGECGNCNGASRQWENGRGGMKRRLDSASERFYLSFLAFRSWERKLEEGLCGSKQTTTERKRKATTPPWPSLPFRHSTG